MREHNNPIVMLSLTQHTLNDMLDLLILHLLIARQQGIFYLIEGVELDKVTVFPVGESERIPLLQNIIEVIIEGFWWLDCLDFFYC
jgi:hypothetical protein